MPRAISLSENIRPILGAIKTVPIPPRPGQPEPEQPPSPFVTISREAGAGAWTLAQRLADALNQGDPGEQPWTCWDRELVEKVAADHHLNTRLVESLDVAQHSWLSDFLSSLSISSDADTADEMRVFRKVASTIQALAQTGRVIVVGRGSMFLTHHMPGGVHVRLVAPLENRIRNMMALLNLSHDQAAAKVRELARGREAFYHRYWPHQPMRPELFTVMINTAMVSPQAAVHCIIDLVRDCVPAAAADASR